MRKLPLLALLLAATFPLALGGRGAAAQEYNTPNYDVQGGADTEIGGTLNIKSGGTFTADTCLAPVDIRLSSATAQTVFLMVANRPWKVESLRARIATAAGGALTAQIMKVPDGVATGSAVAVQTGSFNLNAASNTAQVGVPVATAAGVLATGDALWLSLSNTINATVGVITVCLGPQ